jgi:hypothetical protein
VGVQFGVSLRHQAVFGFGDDPVFRMTRVTIAVAQQKKYLAEKTPAEIALSIERANAYADEQEKNGKQVNLGAIYRQAITQDWGLEYKSKLAREEERRTTTKQAPATEDKSLAVEPEVEDRAGNRAIAAFEALPLPDQKRCLEQFAGTLQEPLRSTYAKKGLSSPMIRRSLSGWLVKAGY